MDYSKQVPATERTLNILEELATEPDGLTAGELMARLEIPRSALFALLNTLKSRDYIEQPDNRGRYVLGTAVLSLSAGKEAGFAPLVTAFQSDGALSMFTGTIALSRLDRVYTVILSQRRGAGRVQSVFLQGEHREATAVADGQVLLAGLPPAQVAQQFPAWHKENQQLLRHIRTSGYMQVDSDETVELACPIYADGMTPLAAI
ncbi:MAG: helix-turn-helix domain-containing protein, partial [Anaerolineales bacterium]|nr:helix-turn-helix domain-containing protein [Anaerolineales bacterium]